MTNNANPSWAQVSDELLLLLPGLLCDVDIWADQVRELRDIAQIVVPCFQTQRSVGDMAQDALALIDGDFSIAGHSMGGYVALEIMRRAPQQVRRLALISTQPDVDGPYQAKRRRNLVNRAEQGEFRAVIASFPSMLFHENRLSESDLIGSFYKMADRTGLNGFLNQQHAIITRPSSLDNLRNITCPTVVLCGRQDQITPLANSRLIEHEVPTATLEILEECGHMVPTEKPQIVSRALRRWLETDPDRADQPT